MKKFAAFIAAAALLASSIPAFAEVSRLSAAPEEVKLVTDAVTETGFFGDNSFTIEPIATLLEGNDRMDEFVVVGVPKGSVHELSGFVCVSRRRATISQKLFRAVMPRMSRRVDMKSMKKEAAQEKKMSPAAYKKHEAMEKKQMGPKGFAKHEAAEKKASKKGY